MRAFVFGFVGRLTPRDDGHGGTSSESRDVEIFASHAADPTLVTALNLVACEVIACHDHDDAGHYQTSFGDSAKRCYTLVVVPRGGKDRSDTTTLACEDGGPPDHSLVSALPPGRKAQGSFASSSASSSRREARRSARHPSPTRAPRGSTPSAPSSSRDTPPARTSDGPRR